MKKRVLWISRHKPLPAQIRYLKERIGEFDLIIHSKPLSTARDAVHLAEVHKADYVVPVLPLSFIMHLVEEAKNRDFVVLRADMENLHNCSVVPCPMFDAGRDTIVETRDVSTGKTFYRHFRFRGFKVLKDVVLVEEDF